MKAAVSYQDASSARDESRTSLLVHAAEIGNSAAITNLIADGANVNAATKEGTTPLMMAASCGQLAALRLLQERGAAVNRVRRDGFNAITLAAFFGHEDVVRDLLNGGADISAKSRDGTTPERWATARGFSNIAELLKESRERIAVKAASRRTEPFQAATSKTQMPAPTEVTDNEQQRASVFFDEGIRRIGQTEWTTTPSVRIDPYSAVSVAGKSFSPFSTLGDRLGGSWKHAAVLVVLILALAGAGTVAWKGLNHQPQVGLETAAGASEQTANANGQTLNQEQPQTPESVNTASEQTLTEPVEPSTSDASLPPISFAELQQANIGANHVVDEADAAKTLATNGRSMTSPVSRKRRQKRALGVVENKQASTETTVGGAKAIQPTPPERRVTPANVNPPRPATLIEGSSIKKKVIQWP